MTFTGWEPPPPPYACVNHKHRLIRGRWYSVVGAGLAILARNIYVYTRSVKHAAVGQLPKKGLLSHIATLKGKDPQTADEDSGVTTLPPVISIGPPVPQKLVQAGEFVDMAELLPDCMGVTIAPLFADDKDEKQLVKTKRRQVTNILKWVQCYSIYVVVLTAKHPKKILDLLGYQALIVEACLEYGSDSWLGYDRRFRQMAAASPDTVWTKIDPTLWSMVFTGQAKSHRCKFCFSLTHPSEDCDWAPTPSPAQQPAPSGIRGPQRQRNL